MIAAGIFDVSFDPMESLIFKTDENTFGQLLIKKVYQGDLQGESTGVMLSVRNKSANAAGGEDTLVLEIVPSSGTGELKFLSGTMKITPENDKHHYHFSYHVEETV